MRILIVDDSQRLRSALTRRLEQEGHRVACATDGEDGLEMARKGAFDLIVLDLILPRMSGFELLRQLRARDDNTHLLILCTRDRAAQRARGLELGADDYLIKPFGFEELRARLGALRRRLREQRPASVQVGSLTLDLPGKRLRRGNIKLPLTPSEFKILEFLTLRKGQVFSKQQLIEHLYSIDAHVTKNTIEVLVSGLRKKLREAGESEVLLTRRGFGYTIEADT